MASGIFEYGRNMFLDAVLGRTASVPTTLSIGLLTVAPANDSDTLAEPSGGGYGRVTVSNDSAFWNGANNGIKFSAQTVYFPAATSDWGTITHYVLIDPATNAGVMWGEFNEPIYVAAGVGVAIDAAMLSASADAPETSIVA